MALVNITNNGTSFIRCAGHCLIRINDTTLYMICQKGDIVLSSTTTNVLDMYRSTNNGGSWSLVASHPSSGTAAYGAISMCIDSAGLIRCVYIHNTIISCNLRYIEFNTSSNSFQNDTLALNLVSIKAPPSLYTATDCAIANDRLHAVFSNDFSSRGGIRDHVSYSNRTSAGAWSSPIYLGSTSNNAYYPYISMLRHPSNGTCVPMTTNISNAITDLAYSVNASVGDTENATSFTNVTLLSQKSVVPASSGLGLTTWYNMPCIVQRANSNVTLMVSSSAGASAGNDAIFVRRNYADSWGTWGTPNRMSTATPLSSGIVQVSGHTRTLGRLVADEAGFFGVEDIYGVNSYMTFNSADNPFRRPIFSNGGYSSLIWTKTRTASYHNVSNEILDFVVESDGDIFYGRTDLNRPN